MSEKTFSLEELDNLRESQDADFKYTLSDVILFLLYAEKDYPIKGKIKQMKEVFLTLQQVFKNENVQPVFFRKYRFGPYSEEVENTIDQLAFLNLISLRGKKTSNNFAIEINDKGQKLIHEEFVKLPENIRNLLQAKRLSWDTHIPQGMLKLVYRDYEHFLENSVFKQRYQTLDWNDETQRPLEYDS
ncbi:hypothetical protein [Nitrosopumilus piranensis]|uniref:Antitoxin SocA-like Panacea domain-containing protein n=1 Tax=Nitrosopumilus piranensis TaxID=1582439 RepID=A0A0C5BTW5_9ARCH|nr:hypothetical protein [Nitrosopumilus piranensis]AJM91726.1 hypothetical protein NPIRD3C_0512 [Nitrosopumilus piranensis]